MSAAEEAKQRGNDLFKARKYRDAVQAYGEALSHDADNALLLLNRSAAYMALSDYKRALSDAERALQLQSPMPSSKAIIRTPGDGRAPSAARAAHRHRGGAGAGERGA